ncbi:C-type mannose receptor 2-like [Candoia aspera]|uniref:C-type mannose receptor 2-like n=1 Tax=Candoia aspera TaxID=51853 RepID=UPI002FD7A8EF
MGLKADAMGFISSFHLPLLGFLAASFFIQGLEAQDCPKNWFKFERHCYGFYKTQLSWNDAETDCHSYGKDGHLASILSEQEMKSISSALLTNHEVLYKVWVGMYAQKGGKSKRMRWTDNSVVDYIPWAPRQPSNCYGKQHCVELFAQEIPNIGGGVSCRFEMGSPEKFATLSSAKDGIVLEPVGPKTQSPSVLPGFSWGLWLPIQARTASRMQMALASSLLLPVLAFLAANFVISGVEALHCPKGWLAFQGNCYGLINLKLPWRDAENDCQQYGKTSHLVSILSETEGDMIASHITTNYNNQENFWIGLYDPNGTQRWRWVDYSAIRYLPWEPGFPKMTRRSACGQLSFTTDFRKWSHTRCSKRAKYICMFKLL